MEPRIRLLLSFPFGSTMNEREKDEEDKEDRYKLKNHNPILRSSSQDIKS